MHDPFLDVAIAVCLLATCGTIVYVWLNQTTSGTTTDGDALTTTESRTATVDTLTVAQALRVGPAGSSLGFVEFGSVLLTPAASLAALPTSTQVQFTKPAPTVPVVVASVLQGTGAPSIYPRNVVVNVFATHTGGFSVSAAPVDPGADMAAPVHVQWIAVAPL